MTASALSPPPLQAPVVTPGGTVSTPWLVWFTAVFQRLGGAYDKVDAAHSTAVAAVPRSTQVVASGGLHVGGSLTGNVGVSLYKAMTIVSSLPTTGNSAGDWAYALNGRKPGEAAGSGTGVPVFWSNGNWLAVTSGATVTS